MDDPRAELKRLIMELPEYELASVYLNFERLIANSKPKTDNHETEEAGQ